MFSLSRSVQHITGVCTRALATTAASKTAPATLGELVDSRSKELLHKDAFRVSRYKDHLLTFQEVKAYADALAVGLSDSRLIPGKNLVMHIANEPESVMGGLSAAKVGFTLTLADPYKHSKSDLTEVWDLFQPRGFLIYPVFDSSEVVSTVREIIPEIDEIYWEEIVQSERYPDLKSPIQYFKEPIEGFLTMRDIFVNDPLPSPLPRFAKNIKPSDPVLIQLTQGLEGPLKGAMFSHSNLLSSATAYSERIGITSTDRVVLSTPFWHVYTHTAFYGILAEGGFSVMPSREFSAATTLEKVEGELATILQVTGEQLSALLACEEGKGRDFSTLQKLVVVNDSSSSKVSKQDIAAAKQLFGVEEVHVALTFRQSASPVFSGLADSAGACTATLLPNTDVKTSKSGTLVIKGAQVMQSYFGENAPTGGWVDTSIAANIEGGNTCNLTA